MVTFRRQKPAGSSFHEYTRQVPGRVGSLLAWIMRRCGTKLCHILQQHGSSERAVWENIKQKQKRCFSPALLERTHRTGRTHSLVLFSPPTSLFAHPLLDEIHTSACARRCAHGSSWCTRCRPASSWSTCSCSLPWRWQVVELDPQRPTALLARLRTVECGKLDALVKVAWWCKRQQRIPAEDEAAKGRTLPAMAAAIAPTAAVTRQVRV